MTSTFQDRGEWSRHRSSASVTALSCTSAAVWTRASEVRGQAAADAPCEVSSALYECLLNDVTDMSVRVPLPHVLHKTISVF